MKKISLCSVVWSIWMCCQHTWKPGKEAEVGALHVSQYNTAMFAMPVRYRANTSAPSEPTSATTNGHHMECAARMENLSPETFRSTVKCRNYIDYTGNLTQDRNKMSAVLSVKSGEKIEILKSFVWVSSPREAEVLGSVLEIWDPSVVLQMEKKEGMRLGFRYLSRLTET